MTQLMYKGYVGSVEVSVEDGVIFGKLLHIRDLVNYESLTVSEIEDSFRAAVDDYLSDCEADGVEPDRPFKGSFNVRVSPDLHRSLAGAANNEGTSLNDYVCKVLACHRHVERDGQIKRPQTELHVVAYTSMTNADAGDFLPKYFFSPEIGGQKKTFSRADSLTDMKLVFNAKRGRVQ